MKKVIAICILSLCSVFDSSAQMSKENNIKLEQREVVPVDGSALELTPVHKSDFLSAYESALTQNSNKYKPFKDRSLAGKILIGAGIAVIATAALLFGTVSIG